MYKRNALSVVIILVSIFALSACNLPERQISGVATPTTPSITVPEPSPTPVSACANPYFPSKLGNTWQYAGSNTATGDYTRTDTVSASSADGFSVDTNLSGITYRVNYACSAGGLTANSPVQQYAGALLNNPNLPVDVKLTSVTGITLPANIAPGSTWQQTADFEATSQQLNVNGRFVFDYTAVGYETVTVPAGTYNALRVDLSVKIEVSVLRIGAGSYDVSTWLAPDVGLVKSEGTSHVSGVDFSDSMQLTSFTPGP